MQARIETELEQEIGAAQTCQVLETSSVWEEEMEYVGL
jgi:hypothetical protein